MEVIQQKLRELEMLAHDSHVPLDLIVLGIRRQFYYAELERNRGNRCKTAREMKIHRNTALRWDEALHVDAGEIRRRAVDRRKDQSSHRARLTAGKGPRIPSQR